MTLGWILEDAWDAYFEAQPAPIVPAPGPARIACPFCALSFRQSRELTEHLGDAHRGERPVLLFRGLEPTQLRQQRIGVSLRPADVIIRNCSSAVVSLNGGPERSVLPSELPKLIASQKDALINLRLVNRIDAAAQPIPSSYEIAISIPDKRSLDAIDRAFRKHLAKDALDFLAVDGFLNDRACAGLARPYAGALADFVRGVLTKDRPSHVHVTMPFAHYRTMYNQAIDGLQAYRRPLSELVCAVIRFAQNTFSEPCVTGFGPLDGAARSLVACVLSERHLVPIGPSEMSAGPSAAEPSRVEVCPLDDGVSRVLDLWARLEKRRHWTQTLEDECRHASNAATLDAPDREKVLALWAMAALRAAADATEPLSRLAPTYPFGPWASSEREKLAE